MSNESVPKTKVAVYCGSSPGNDPRHLAMARNLAHAMAKRNIGLGTQILPSLLPPHIPLYSPVIIDESHFGTVYGGGTIGIMGEVARTLVSLSGPSAVHGVIPEPLIRYERNLPRDSLSSTGPAPTDLAVPDEDVFGRTTVVPDMHTRKQMMAKEVFEGGPGSGFVALSGGFGTMEEIFETATWNQLGIHSKGICLLSVGGFYDGILEWIRKSADEGFIGGANKDILVTATDAEGALDALKEYRVSADTLKLEWGMQ